MKRGDEKRTARVIESLARLLLLLLLQMQELNGWLQNGNAGVGVVIICHRETTNKMSAAAALSIVFSVSFFLSFFPAAGPHNVTVEACCSLNTLLLLLLIPAAPAQIKTETAWQPWQPWQPCLAARPPSNVSASASTTDF
jgi:hypothetical protein